VIDIRGNVLKCAGGMLTSILKMWEKLKKKNCKYRYICYEFIFTDSQNHLTNDRIHIYLLIIIISIVFIIGLPLQNNELY